MQQVETQAEQQLSTCGILNQSGVEPLSGQPAEWLSVVHVVGVWEV